MRITSTRNPTVAFLRELQRPAERRRRGLYVAEGVLLVREAVTSAQSAAIALYDPALLTRSEAGSFLLETLPTWADAAHEADARVLAAAGQTDAPSGVIAALRLPEQGALASHAGQPFGLVLDGLVDPGNAGTILRTASAAGVDYVVATAGSVDLFAPKVVRAGMGAHFRLALHNRVTWSDVRSSLPESNFVAMDPLADDSIYAFSWPQPLALVVGSEAHGLSREAAGSVDFRVRIPMRRGTESLNAAVAASVVMYHVLGPFIPVTS